MTAANQTDTCCSHAKILLFLAIPALATTLAAQPTIPATNAKVRAALDMLKADNAWTLQQQIELTQIPSPPFKESVRGAEYKRRLEALGLRNVRIDSIGNVIAERRGTWAPDQRSSLPDISTRCFRKERTSHVKRDGDKLRAPGSATTIADSRSCSPSRAPSRRRAFRRTGTVYFVGNVGEEGPGNLRGTRHLLHQRN